jgi:hypothetical protein
MARVYIYIICYIKTINTLMYCKNVFCSDVKTLFGTSFSSCNNYRTQRPFGHVMIYFCNDSIKIYTHTLSNVLDPLRYLRYALLLFVRRGRVPSVHKYFRGTYVSKNIIIINILISSVFFINNISIRILILPQHIFHLFFLILLRIVIFFLK